MAASSICQISPTRCQARTRLYRDGKLELEGFPVADISDYLADGSVMTWLDLRGPGRDDLAVLSEVWRESRLRRLHRHHCPDRAGALPHLQTQGLAVRPKIARAGQFRRDPRAVPGRIRGPAVIVTSAGRRGR
jgi:hypothetical protein